MELPHPDVDPGGLLEYSVVFTDRSLNHMSQRFIGVMQDLVAVLRTTYHADGVAVVPGGGTVAMEAVARQLVTGRRALVIRTGLFSYRWSQILDVGAVTTDVTVCTARPDSPARDAAWSPPPPDEVVATIRRARPEVVLAAHVETASGMVLPDEYVQAVGEATHEVGGLFVLDAIASGALWVDMAAAGVDVLLSAPQKGWSGTPGVGYVMLADRGRAAVDASESTSFAMDLRKWLSIADGYVDGRAAYHSTMPTDAIARNAAVMRDTQDRGLESLRASQIDLGGQVRALLAERGFRSVAAEGYEAPGVVVVHTDDPGLQSGARLREVGIQAAAGVPLMCGEPADFSTCRVGLFGLDKLADVDGTVARLAAGLDRLRLA
ncbi:MAG TPA: alanine--glyoxylate aminotransferase family protein [Intrasporangium sp.]|uniref:alanine--glyoxylate aminotransferase family protein n=1 Tax=Intrasporangium sp. TaxID=1925024 RepID=UPI002B45C124|nr:alanine--glyoxylate aminotransferase family protein [Intrasporangium sp.]HKX68365.1 alanine--glyoxylate aminotransferase family protein [Intrasporangium sp.]